MQIVVWKDKHGESYYDASTLEAWDASAIEILRQLTGEYGYMYEPTEPRVSEETQRLADIDLDALDGEVRAQLEKKVQAARHSIRRNKLAFELAKKQRDLALKYVADGSSPTMTRGAGTRWEKQVPAAWLILEERNGYEYEDFSVETVFSA